jgi:hypothetical protein
LKKGKEKRRKGKSSIANVADAEIAILKEEKGETRRNKREENKGIKVRKGGEKEKRREGKGNR